MGVAVARRPPRVLGSLEERQGLRGLCNGLEKVDELRNATGVLVVGRHAGHGVGAELPGEEEEQKVEGLEKTDGIGRGKGSTPRTDLAWRASSTASLCTVVPTWTIM